MALRIVEGKPLAWTEDTLGSMLLARAEAKPEAPQFLVKGADGAFEPWSRADVAQRAREIAAGLARLGIGPGDRVAILADTRAEWALADFGILLAGGVTVTVYPTLPADQVLYLLRDCGALFVFVDTAAQQRKLASILPEAPKVRGWASFEPLVGELDAAAPAPGRTLDDLRAMGREALAAEPGLVGRRLEKVSPHDESTIIYTSGTTGVPKGASLTHANWIAASASVRQVFELERYAEPRTVAFLPLAHVLSRLLLVVFTDLGGTVAFSSPRTLGADFAEIKPRAVVCVPRLWERMHQQIHKTVAERPAPVRALFARAETIALRYGRAVSDGGRPSTLLALQHALYDRLVYRGLRAKLGFTDLQGALSTAAAIRPDLLHFFQGIGVNVLELWGMTEMAGPGVTNTMDRFKPGTVGWPIPGLSVALDEEDEILVSGPNVFAGYHHRPEENAACFVEAEGRRWFRTGDLGAFDADGALRIVDRKKEIEVLDTGKKIAPIAVEERLKSLSPYVMEACLVATGRKHAAMLVQPDYDRLLRWARENGVPFDAARIVVRPDPTGNPMTYAVGEDLLSHPRVRALYQEAIDRLNAAGADFERVRAFHLVPHVFTIDREELTLTLKKKRRVILANYREEVEAMFAPAVTPRA